jgi:hypothetical protein
MSKWLAVTAVITAVTGCNYGAQSFTCSDDLSCGASGRCEPDVSLCSFPDGACMSGRRFGDLAGGQSNQCVGEVAVPIDAAIDAPPDVPPIDARVCFGNEPFTICLAAAPTMPLAIAADTNLNTAVAAMCTPTVSGATDYCVVAATTITISAKLRGFGAKPLVLLASESITVSGPNGQIDVGSHRADPNTGAGANPAVCVAGSNPGTRAGGSGGSFTGTGGPGGGGGGGGGTGGTAAAGIGTANITTVRGGCPGHEGNGGDRGAGGRGGGAVFLIAGTRIEIGGRGITAGGEGGAPGRNNGSGGGGGGTGGMIGFDAPTITANALLLASGGGGGEGAGDTVTGEAGDDATETAPANGGNGAQLGGNGGQGSADNVASAAGGAGAVGGTLGGNTDGGGGGGGGAAGVIKAPATATLGTQLSPPVTP